jgi:NADH-quinone oxidoreductase subunit M
MFTAILIASHDRIAGTVQPIDHYLNGLNGAMMVMVAHGFNTGGLFFCIGVLYERAHTRLISAFGGVAGRMPVYSVLFGVFMFASIGLPGLSGFVGEFLVALATWQYNKLAAAITFSVVIFAAWYMMWLYQRLLFGRAPGEMPDPGDTELTVEEEAMLSAGGDHGHGHGHAQPAIAGGSVDHGHAEDHDSTKWPDITWTEAWALIPLAVLTVFFGVYPRPVFSLVQPALERIIAPFLT